MTDWQAHADALADERDFAKHWQTYRDAFADRRPQDGPPTVWAPDAPEDANLAWLAAQAGVEDFEALHAWSIDDRGRYWDHVLRRLDVPLRQMPTRILAGDAEHPAWLQGALLNIAEACWNGDAPAIIAGREGSDAVETWSRDALRELADRVSHGLTRLGLGRGDAVGLYMPMNAECVAAYIGIVKAGIAVVSIPDSFAAGEVATRLRLGGAQAVVTVDAFQRGGKSVPMAPKAREAAATVGAKAIVIGDTEPGDVAWNDLIAEGGAFEPVACDPQDVTNILFSSGTTGEPKAIPWTHLTPIKAAADGHFHQDIRPGDVVAWPTNIGWMMGPWLIYAALVNKATIALWEGVPTSQAFVRFLADTKAAMVGVVPAIVRAWRESGVAAPGDLPDVRVFSSTGEASNAHDMLYLMSLARYQAPVIEYCGGTEIGGAHITGSVWQPASPATFTTPALGLDFVVLDDDARPVDVGEHGQIYLVPPSMGLSQRLLNRDHHEEYFAGCPRGPGGEALRRHGDEVHVLHGGFWAAGGRADDTMNLGGIKVSSIELEAVMNGHPGVSETAAVAVPEPGGGADRLVVFVVGAGAPDLQADLQQRIKQRLNPLFRIHDVVVVDKLPRTPSNKVMRRELRADYAEANARSVA